MAERNIPPVGDLLGLPLPSEDLQRPQSRGDLLDYYLGPTGIPDRLRAANEVLNPIRGLSDAMYYSGQVANPDLSASERRSMAKQAAMETGIAALPVGLAKVAGRYARAVPGGQADDAQAVVETMTGATPDLQDPARRKFLTGMGAAAVAPLLPAEELLATGTRATARGAGSSALGGLLAKKAQQNAAYGVLAEALKPLDRIVAQAPNPDNVPDILMTPQTAQQIQEAGEALAQRKEIVGELAGVDNDLSILNDEITDTLLKTEKVDDIWDALEPQVQGNLASDTMNTLIKRASQKQGLMGVFDAADEFYQSLDAGNAEGLVDIGLTRPEADLAIKMDRLLKNSDATFF